MAFLAQGRMLAQCPRVATRFISAVIGLSMMSTMLTVMSMPITVLAVQAKVQIRPGSGNSWSAQCQAWWQGTGAASNGPSNCGSLDANSTACYDVWNTDKGEPFYDFVIIETVPYGYSKGSIPAIDQQMDALLAKFQLVIEPSGETALSFSYATKMVPGDTGYGALAAPQVLQNGDCLTVNCRDATCEHEFPPPDASWPNNGRPWLFCFLGTCNDIDETVASNIVSTAPGPNHVV